MIELIVGTNSTWSLRAWICAQLVDVSVEVIVINLERNDAKLQLSKLTPSEKVPCLKVDNVSIHDSLSIAEYF
ncbi:glutathione S-transferase N-terminal domain-containing protein [Aliikangiella sp. G2MR2-5]|uniref:glutathione S-transferase N-terminal domain-containing protein n=1 Tax=Aliikangiella sp. G2MR2-5 TaxID=2788943 RepID=UPI001AED2F6E|nr:glutathione S-transferase N-terminal domain-containing protein [Aliikangiella sp. G2MR2-5]